jgi:serine/threonine protein kinase
MKDIALQMGALHSVDVVHKDLKASNVLIGSCLDSNPESAFVDVQFNVLDGLFTPMVVDYECANGVMGTGFWRAPEVLLGIRDPSRRRSPTLFTKKSDVYSYGMLCYEIVTGFLPFEREGFETCRADMDRVINGQRPTFPDDVDWKVKELISSCWHQDENQRPTFEETNDRLCRNIGMGRVELKMKFDPLLLSSNVLTPKRRHRRAVAYEC